MMALQLAEAAAVLDARRITADVRFRGVSTDSRDLQEGNLFVALQGPNFDGHDYIERAREQGAAAAAVSRTLDTALPLIEVDDTRQALGQLSLQLIEHIDTPGVEILLNSPGRALADATSGPGDNGDLSFYKTHNFFLI